MNVRGGETSVILQVLWSAVPIPILAAVGVSMTIMTSTLNALNARRRLAMAIVAGGMALTAPLVYLFAFRCVHVCVRVYVRVCADVVTVSHAVSSHRIIPHMVSLRIDAIASVAS